MSPFPPWLTHANFLARKTGVLQLLCEDHASIVYALGGRSGRDDDKLAACNAAGFDWIQPPPSWGAGDAEPTEKLLTGCAIYLRLVQVGDLIPCGEHDVAICTVEGMLAPPEGDGPTMADALSSARLRELGIITDRGKAVEPE